MMPPLCNGGDDDDDDDYAVLVVVLWRELGGKLVVWKGKGSTGAIKKILHEKNWRLVKIWRDREYKC